LSAQALTEALPSILAGASVPVPQRNDLATVAPKLAKADAQLDWRADARALERQVRAFNPWPVAEAQLVDGRRLRIWDAVALTGPAAAPGSIVNVSREGIDVATGEGTLRVLRLQPPSARAMDAAAYLAAHSLEGAAFAV